MLAYSIYRQLQRQPDWKTSLHQMFDSFSASSLLTFLIVFALMWVNWGIEARKWQLAIRQLQTISFASAFKAVFTGTTIAFFTPNRIGEYMGRILYINEANRIQAISLTIVCSMAQLLVTLSAGFTALFVLKSNIVSRWDSSLSSYWINISLCIIAGFVLAVGILYFRLR